MGTRLGGRQRGQSPARGWIWDQRSCLGPWDSGAHLEPDTGMQEPRGRGMWGCRMGDAGQLPGRTSPTQAFTCPCRFPGKRHLEALARAGTCAPEGTHRSRRHCSLRSLGQTLWSVRGDALTPDYGLPWLCPSRSNRLVPRMSPCAPHPRLAKGKGHWPPWPWQAGGCSASPGRAGSGCRAAFQELPPHPVPASVESTGRILARAPCQPAGPCPPPAWSGSIC